MSVSSFNRSIISKPDLLKLLHKLFDWEWLTIVLVSWALLMFYFRVAKRLSIVDVPNSRSSHQSVTIRGAGIIFVLIFLLGLLNETMGGQISYSLRDGIWVVLGFILISSLSFWDDIRPLSPGFRLVVQLISVLLMVSGFWDLGWWLILVVIVILGIINAYNFMDGINGITVMYSAVSVGGILLLRKQLGLYESWYDNSMLGLFGAFAVFAFFNLRIRAICFAGDVGAISIAFLLCYGLMDVVMETGNLGYVLVLGIYGLDSVATIVFRKLRGESLSEAHRSHLYQYLANEKKYKHVWVALIFAALQLVINVVILRDDWLLTWIFFGLVVVVYLGYRINQEGWNRLVKKY